MIRWVVSQQDIYLIVVDEIGDSFHKLSSSAVILWTVIQIDNKRRNMRKSLLGFIEEIMETINNKVAGDCVK